MSLFNGVFKMTQVIYKLMQLNILWLVYVLRGFVIFGLYPATVALFSVIRQLDKRTDSNVYQLFRDYFKQEFKLSNSIGLPTLFIGYLLLVCYQFLAAGNLPMYVSVRYIVLMAIMILVVHTTYLFPIISHYNFARLRDYWKLPIVFGLGYIGRTMLIFILLAISYYAFVEWSVLIPFLGMSVNCYLIYKMTKGLFMKHPI